MITSVFHVVISTIQLHHKLLNNWATYKGKKIRRVLLSPFTTQRRQGHPTTVFCKASVRRIKYCLKFSIIREWLKVCQGAFHLGTIFEAYLKISLRFSEV